MRNLKRIVLSCMLMTTLASCGVLNSEGLKFDTVEELTTDTSNFSVITIGTGTPKYTENKVKSSTAIKYNGNYYIVDCGDGSFERMEAEELNFKNVQGIFFTHHHIDHTTDFFDLYTKCLLPGGKGISIVGPPRTGEFIDFYNSVYLDDVLYRKLNVSKSINSMDRESLSSFADVSELTGSSEIELDGIKISTAEMTHTMYNLAYRFEADGKSIVISGDTSYDEDLISLSKGADILVIDGTLYKENAEKDSDQGSYIEPFYKFGGRFEVDSHLDFEDMVEIASKAGVKKLVITHYNEASQNRIDKSIAKINETFNGEVIYATDMMEIFVEDTIESTPKTQNLEYSYPIVDTNQIGFYSDTAEIDEPGKNDSYYGQDGSYISNQPSYTDNKDGTVTDNVTGLMWVSDMGEKMTFEEASIYANTFELGGYNDWRIPTIKELYSLIQFNGRVFGDQATEEMFIDTDYFVQPLGDASIGERQIDAQTWSSTVYAGSTMKSDETIFGVNFIDGRIKGYPKYSKRTGSDNKMYFRLVRGNTAYGNNEFVDNGDGTITDLATGLTWQQEDSGIGMNWEDSLSYAENLNLAGYDDWRLPNAKELQSIVDYTRSLQTTNSPAINELFETTSIKDIEGNMNYPYFWTGTTHFDGRNPYSGGVYLAFGEALGEMHNQIMDVHGAGAQRSDPKSGNADDYPISFGPQGDIRMVYNYVRCVRNN